MVSCTKGQQTCLKLLSYFIICILAHVPVDDIWSLFIVLAFCLHLLVVSFTVAFLLHVVVRSSQSQSYPESCYAYDFSERSEVDTCGFDDPEDYSVRSCTLEQLLEKLDEFLDFIAHPDSDIQVIVLGFGKKDYCSSLFCFLFGSFGINAKDLK